MKKFDFRLFTEDDLILIETTINGFPLMMALDTGASQTVIDWNALVLAGCLLPYRADPTHNVAVETAAGIIDVQTYVVAQFSTLGIEKTDFPILTYDFLAKGFVSSYDGVLGIDFFRQQSILTIDFVEEKLWLASKKN